MIKARIKLTRDGRDTRNFKTVCPMSHEKHLLNVKSFDTNLCPTKKVDLSTRKEKINITIYGHTVLLRLEVVGDGGCVCVGTRT